MRVLYLTYNSIISLGILQSQVVGLLRRLARDNGGEPIHFWLVVAERKEDYAKAGDREKWRSLLAEDGIRITFVRKSLPYMLRMQGQEGNRKKAGSIRHILLDNFIYFFTFLSILIRFRPHIVHCRSYIPGIYGRIAKLFFRRRFLFDPRGIIPEEGVAAGSWTADSSRYRRLKKLESKLLRAADHTVVLSEPFKRHYEKQGFDRPMSVIPCSVDMARFPAVKAPPPDFNLVQGAHPRIAVFLMGALVPYQDLEGAVGAFLALREIHPETLLQVFTPDIEQTLELLAEISPGYSGINVIFIPYENMPDKLIRADIAILTRMPGVISEVASPVKFAEYLAAGLPVFCRAGIGDTAGILRESRTGVVFEDATEETLRKAAAEFWSIYDEKPVDIKARCRTAAAEHFSWDIHAGHYRRIYEGLK